MSPQAGKPALCRNSIPPVCAVADRMRTAGYPRYSFPEQPKENGQNGTDKHARHDREMKSEVSFAVIMNVPWQSAQPVFPNPDQSNSPTPAIINPQINSNLPSSFMVRETK